MKRPRTEVFPTPNAAYASVLEAAPLETPRSLSHGHRGPPAFGAIMLETPGPDTGFERSFFEAPAAARLFVRLARRAGPIGDAAGGIARRLLVAGPAGAGKKTLARAIAGELQAGFAILTRATSQSPTALATALHTRDVQARAVGQSTVVYFETEDAPRWASAQEERWPDYMRWLHTWATGTHVHLYLIVGVPDAHRVEPSLADATLSVCALSPPSAATRQKLWERALADDAPGGVVTFALAADAFEKVVVRPSEGMWPGDIGDALRIAMRSAMLAQPDAATLGLSAGELRDGIRHVQARRMDDPASQLRCLSLS